VSNFSGSGDTYSFTLTPIGQGLVRVFVPADVAQDSASNLNLISNNLSFTYDNISSTVMLTTNSPSLTNSIVSVTATFAEAVIGFDINDLSITNGTASNFTGSGSSYSFDITPDDQGVVSVYIPDSVSVDLAGNLNTVSNTLNFTYDTLGPVITEITPVPDPTGDSTPDYVFNSNEAGTIIYGGICSSNTTNAVVGNNLITFNLLPDGYNNDCNIAVVDSLSNVSNLLVLSAFTIVNGTPPVIVSVTSTNPSGTYGISSVIDLDFTFSKDVTSTGNVTVTFETGIAVGWSSLSGALNKSSYL